MPTYEFVSDAGEVVEEYHPHDKCPRKITRNGRPFRKVPFPSSVVTFTERAPSPMCQKTQVLNGYKKLEEQGKLRSSFSAKQVKEAWEGHPTNHQ